MGRRSRSPGSGQHRPLAIAVGGVLVAALVATALLEPRPAPTVSPATGARASGPWQRDHVVGDPEDATPDELPASDITTSLPAASSPAAPAVGGTHSTHNVQRAVRRPPDRPNRSAEAAAGPTAAASHARYDGDVPDPSLFEAGGVYWAVGTQSGLRQIQVLSSVDLTTWEHRGDALGHLPSWAEWGWAWAPSVLTRPAGFVLYYTTRHAETGLQCISRATSVVPQGPYVDASTEPFICQYDRGGSIDPQPFVDADGAAWLLWKSEGTLDGEPTRIWVRRLSSDGMRLEGAAFELLATSQPWEGPLIEGPAMLRVGDHYHLLYAGNRWETADYTIGHARCAAVTGPCTRVGDGRALGSADPELGPGSPSPLMTLSGELVLGYHAWTAPAVGYPDGARRLHLAGLRVVGDELVVHRPWAPAVP